jgi:hypothetical protein
VCAHTGLVADNSVVGMGEFIDRDMGGVHWYPAESHFGDLYWPLSNQNTAMAKRINFYIFLEGYHKDGSRLSSMLP